MSDEDPREYNREFTASADHRARRRLGIDVERGRVRRFVVQLEYLVDPVSDEWATVVRYDHDAEGADESTHDVTEEGVHIDIYREGGKIDTHELTPPLPANEAAGIGVLLNELPCRDLTKERGAWVRLGSLLVLCGRRRRGIRAPRLGRRLRPRRHPRW